MPAEAYSTQLMSSKKGRLASPRFGIMIKFDVDDDGIDNVTF